MRIDVKIPYSENEDLAEAYNRALEESTADWVLFLDHDVFLCNPKWYDMCLAAIKTLEVDPKAACVGCACGGEHHKRTMEGEGVPTSLLDTYIAESISRYHEFGNMLQKKHRHTTGYFLLLNRAIALATGFRQIKKSVNNIDKDFGNRLIKGGYNIYHMPGLYIYHRRGMRHLRKDFKIQGND